ncbi:MAG: hypothetical protein ABH849_02930 [Nanoarchaeota archaeon]
MAKKEIGFIGGILILIVLLIFISELRESPLSENEIANESLSNVEESVNYAIVWWLIIGSIGGIIGIIVLITKLKDEFTPPVY